MRLVVLGSGSGGNCTLLEGPRTRLLIDAGFGARSLRRRLRECRLDEGPCDAVLLTHGHSDHVSGLGSLVRDNSMPVYANDGALDDAPALGAVVGRRTFASGRHFEVGEFAVEAFSVSHDSSEPVGFRVACDGVQGAVLTDVGALTPPVRRALKGCDWLVVESNHDEELVRIGPYPWELKQRVLGPEGHLSNRELAGFFASDAFDNRPAHVFLAHLSRTNNVAEVARETAENALADRLPLFRHSQASVHLTHQSKPSIVVSL